MIGLATGHFERFAAGHLGALPVTSYTDREISGCCKWYAGRWISVVSRSSVLNFLHFLMGAFYASSHSLSQVVIRLQILIIL